MCLKNTPGNAKAAAEQPMDRHSSDGRDDSRFPQDVQGCETRSRFTHDDAGGTHDRCYHSSRRPMGSDDTVAVVASRGATPADQAQQVGGRCRDVDLHASALSTTEGSQSIRLVRKLFEVPSASCDRETRLLEGGKVPAREGSEEGTARRMEEQKNKAIRAPPRRHRPLARAPTLEQMNDQASKLDPGAESPSRTCASAARGSATTPSITDPSDRNLFSSTRHTACCQTETSHGDCDESRPD